MSFLIRILRVCPLLVISLAVAPLARLSADTIYLKNGQTLTGDIVQQSRSEISIQTTAGVKRVQKTTIRRVVFSSRQEQDGAAREEAARKARQEEAARKAREAAAREQQAETARQEEAARKAREEAARKAQEEARRKQQEQAAAERAAQEAAEQARRESEGESITRGGALWRSLILPGWGQAYQGRGSAAWGYGGSFLAVGAWTALSASEYRSRQAALDAASSSLNFSVVVLGAALPTIDPTLALRPQLFGLQFLNFAERNAANGAARSANRNLQLGSLLLGAVYVASIVDVVVFHPGEAMSVAFFTSPDSGAGLRLQLRF